MDEVTKQLKAICFQFNALMKGANARDTEAAPNDNIEPASKEKDEKPADISLKFQEAVEEKEQEQEEVHDTPRDIPRLDGC